jgi:RND family efflux transporter MFP subunit
MKQEKVMNCTLMYQENVSIIHKRSMVCFLGALCCLAALAGCSNDTAGAGESAAMKAPIRVNILTVQVEKSTRTISLTGFTEPVRRATPAARIMAKVMDAGFQEGDRVEAGRLLISLDTRDLLANKRKAQAAFNAASTALDVAQLNYKRMTALYGSQTVSRHQVETAQVADAQANAAREAARAAVEELDVNLSYSVVRAPFTGIVVRKMVETGNMVAPGQGLFIIEDDSRLRVIASVGSDLAEKLKAGQKLSVRMGGETVQGVIEGIVPSGSTDSPGLRVQLIIENSGHRFKAGTLAVVEVPLDAATTTSVSIPKSALVEKGSLSGVYVVTKDSTARLHWLILEEDSGNIVRVLSGLHGGDRVILSPDKARVADGMPVKEINP